MDPAEFLVHLRRELQAFATCLCGDLSARVTTCGDWTLRDLAEHLGRSNEWVVAAVREGRGDYQAPEAPTDPVELAAWFDRTGASLLEVLQQDPSQDAWTIYPPHTVGFWRRRRCLETLLHRWDAEHALGIDSGMDPELAGEGIAEVIDTIAPRQIALGRAASPTTAVRLLATDTDASWVLGPGNPVATVASTAPNLLLMLWNRLSSGDPALGWEGDHAAGREVLSGALVP
ncbi:maleylpyruvate isomerase family mycothiol-dependent enzyme [Actinospica robiniae]|uniref:maleylpyruvate isomerase family mycothiol-dependent enzyme n=1 Tax=Actinospica robiniae TaxID=304901 RepID=UPI00040BF390|nr:maleylpyruvate isomerase family mycothiol-dependent enzyme [Actinospica robiniae]